MRVRIKLPPYATIETWFALNLFHIGASLAAIGALGPEVPKLLGFLPPIRVIQIAHVVALCGAAGAAIANPNLWIKLALPRLYPVTPAMHDAALDRLVLPIAKPVSRDADTIPPPPPDRAA